MNSGIILMIIIEIMKNDLNVSINNQHFDCIFHIKNTTSVINKKYFTNKYINKYLYKYKYK